MSMGNETPMILLVFESGGGGGRICSLAAIFHCKFGRADCKLRHFFFQRSLKERLQIKTYNSASYSSFSAYLSTLINQKMWLEKVYVDVSFTKALHLSSISNLSDYYIPINCEISDIVNPQQVLTQLYRILQLCKMWPHLLGIMFLGFFKPRGLKKAHP